MKPTIYLPWLGELRHRGFEGGHYLLDIAHLCTWNFDVTREGHLDFLYAPGFISPIPLASSTPVRAIQVETLSKDPFHGSKSQPVIPTFSRWYWSPILGWTYFASEGSKRAIFANSPSFRRLLDQDEQTRVKEFPAQWGTIMWGPNRIAEIVKRSPFFLCPQKFILRPL